MGTTKFTSIGVAAGALATAIALALGFDPTASGALAVVVSALVVAGLKRVVSNEELETTFGEGFNAGYEEGYTDRGKES